MIHRNHILFSQTKAGARNTVKVITGLVCTGLALHPHTMHVYVLGETLWMSADSGATFLEIYRPSKASLLVSSHT